MSTNIVADSLILLKDEKENVQYRGVKMLSALAQTGEHILCHPECADEFASGWRASYKATRE